MRRPLILTAIAVALVVGAFLFSPFLTSKFAPKKANEFAIGITQFPSTFHPNIDSMAAKSYIMGMAYRPITVYGPDWEVHCMLCTTLPTLENGLAKRETTTEGKDGIAVTYTLKADAVWGDGTPITSADVVFGWEVGKHPKSGLTSSEPFTRVLSIDVVNDKTFTLHMDRVEFTYNHIGDYNILPAHIERPIFEADPENYRVKTSYQTDVTNPGLYSGPYRITDVARGSHVVLERNPRWTGKAPQFDRIVVMAVENTSALEANLMARDVDMIAGELGLTVDQALDFEKRYGAKFQIIYKPGLVYEHIDLNLDNPILADIRVRKALLHAIDRESLTTQLFEGKQPVAHGNVNPLDWVHSPDMPHYAYDPQKAAALLDEAGWRKGASGVRQNAKGERLSLSIMTTAGNRSRELVEQVLQSQWKQIGIDVSIRNEPARVLFGETVSKRKFPAMALFAWMSAPESVPRTTLHSTMIPTEANGWAGQNYTGFADPGVDALLDEIEVELDRTKRKAMWIDLQKRYAEALPVLPLYFRANAYILPKGLTGLVPTGHMEPSTLWVEDWTWTR